MDRGRGRNTGAYSDFRGRSPYRGSRHSSHRNNPEGADRSFANDNFDRGNGMFLGRGNNSRNMSSRSVSKNSNRNSPQGYMYQQKKPVADGEDGFSQSGKARDPRNSGETSPKQRGWFADLDLSNAADLLSLSTKMGQIGKAHIAGSEDSAVLCVDSFREVNNTSVKDASGFTSEYGISDQPSEKVIEKKEGIKDSGQPENVKVTEPFDICLPKSGNLITLKPSLLAMNREKRREITSNLEEEKGIILRPGMVLLRNYLSMSDQAKIVKQCRDLGLGLGGFYQPGYQDGAKLHLKMMCLGKNWDPESGRYGDHRLIDGAKPPIIPPAFSLLVVKAIKDSHALIERDSKRNNAVNILPWVSPNICIVNFYSESGNLGLHQDKDESRESLDKGLPVVSFSLGDSAEFLYGDQRNANEAQKIELKSGDVLIFGGKSRHIFHGVTAILPKTAPKSLLEETNLRPGRLNLTFREY
ncbi:2OG-FeII_Oxy_2 domain-containing protein [Cephalotus follicularis]|uniref:DNA N(6)-methyladenine demethylase n=1 Tax=Cephalotus follicularis TaxID=3775 RepID=A0A1Q3B0S6_CEPFO|nr:2OG-FeII_Oxy_2 domain-containing protein [Cephalotus follicularis]